MDPTAVTHVPAPAGDATWMARALKNVLLGNREQAAHKVSIDSHCRLYLLTLCALPKYALFIIIFFYCSMLLYTVWS